MQVVEKIKTWLSNPDRSTDSVDFEQLALDLFSFQSVNNPIYSEYLFRIGKKDYQPAGLEQIPFLPIALFKTREVICQGFEKTLLFRSSGTGGNRSSHWISDSSFCSAHSRLLFNEAVGEIYDMEILALLPGYEENPASSLLFMVKELARETTRPAQFLGMNFGSLHQALKDCRNRGHRPLVFGVSHALLQLIESGNIPDLSDACLIETGGMKGLRQEMSKTSLLEMLQDGLMPFRLISEFGMCELSSQAYAFPELYKPGPGLKVLCRNPEDLLGNARQKGRGVLNFIDLANFSSCAFIAGEDLGEVFEDGSFRISGRMDLADVRGCNLLFAS